MNKVRSKNLLWLAIVFVLGINALIILQVLLNRSAVLVQLELSERELNLPHRRGFVAEDSSQRLHLKWNTPMLENQGENWRASTQHYHRQLRLSDAHFASLKLADCTTSLRRYHKQKAWVLAELNGQSHLDQIAAAEQRLNLFNTQAWTVESHGTEQQFLQQKQDAVDWVNATKQQSRLWVIDAAASEEMLQKTLRDRPLIAGAKVLIVPAEVTRAAAGCESESSRTDITVARLAIESFYVPKDLAKLLPNQSESSQRPQFKVILNYGRLQQPWISHLQ